VRSTTYVEHSTNTAITNIGSKYNYLNQAIRNCYEITERDH